MADRFVGFYWTRPVNWAGFRDVSKDIDQAVQQSKTIHYQRELIRRKVLEWPGKIVAEFAYVDTNPEKATSSVWSVLDTEVLPACRKHEAILALVDFTNIGWRPNQFIVSYCSKHLGPEDDKWVRFEVDENLPLEDLPTGGIKTHFEHWHRKSELMKGNLKAQVQIGLRRALEELPTGTRKEIANWLNSEGFKSTTGRPWTDENVRAALKKHGISKLKDE